MTDTQEPEWWTTQERLTHERHHFADTAQNPECRLCAYEAEHRGEERSRLIAHLHDDHGGYPAGHDFVLVSTAHIRAEHERKHAATARLDRTHDH